MQGVSILIGIVIVCLIYFISKDYIEQLKYDSHNKHLDDCEKCSKQLKNINVQLSDCLENNKRLNERLETKFSKSRKFYKCRK